MTWQVIGNYFLPMSRGRLLTHVSGSSRNLAWRSDLRWLLANSTREVIRLPPFADASQRLPPRRFVKEAGPVIHEASGVDQPVSQHGPQHEHRTYTFIASDYKPKPGGIAAYLDSLARGLIDRGARVRVLAVVPAEDHVRLTFLDRYELWVSPFPVTYDERPRNWVGYGVVSVLEMLRCVPSAIVRRLVEQTGAFAESVRSINQLQKLLPIEKPNIVVFGHLDLNLYPFALYLAEQRIPYGIIAHDSEIYRNSSRINDIVRRGMMLKRAAWVAANSNHTRLLLNQWRLPSNKVMIVRPPISEEALREGRIREPKSGDRYNLITIGRLVKAKGIDIVLRALAILNAEGVDFQYVVVGDGSQREALEKLAQAVGIESRVHFTGFISDEAKWPLLRKAEAFVMPSRVDPRVQHEGFGLAFLEAAAFGVAGLGSTGGGIPEAVIDGQTGLLVPEDSVERLAEALIFLHRNPGTRHAMASRALQRARTEFSSVTIAAHFDDEVRKRWQEV